MLSDTAPKAKLVMRGRKPSQFCKEGHDKTVTGVLDNGRCKVCREKSRKARYETKKEELAQKSKKWYQENKEEILERKRIDRQENPEEYRARDRNRYWQDPEKARARGKDYYQDHAEERKEYSRQYYTRPGIKEEKSLYNHAYWHENKERLKPKKAIHRALYKERAKEISRLYRLANRECLLEYHKDYGRANRPTIRERERRDRINNPDRHRAKKHNRRKVEGTLSAYDIRDIYDMNDGVCCLCLGKLVNGETHLEHVVPVKRNGTNWSSNVLLAHAGCNAAKGGKTPLEYLLNWPVVTERYNMSELHGTKE